MTEQKAFELLINDGWNTEGAFEILDALEGLEEITEDELGYTKRKGETLC